MRSETFWVAALPPAVGRVDTDRVAARRRLVVLAIVAVLLAVVGKDTPVGTAGRGC